MDGQGGDKFVEIEKLSDIIAETILNVQSIEAECKVVMRRLREHAESVAISLVR